MAGDARRVGMLAPMQVELQPIVRRLGLVGDGVRYEGRGSNGVDVLAMLTYIGMDNGARAATEMLEHGVDHVIVVGIAGGVDPNLLNIGDVVVPETVVRRATERASRPTFLGSIVPRGTLSCGDDLITDPEALAGMGATGVIAIDMETAAVAEVCTDAGVPWSVFRGISDFAGEGLIDAAFLAFTNPDGSADAAGVAKYLEENPDRVAGLERLSRDMTLATEAAADAAIVACAAL